MLGGGGGDGPLSLFDFTAREKPPLVFKAHDFPVLSLVFAPDGRTFATGSSGKDSICLWDSTTGLPKPRKFAGQVGHVWALAFSPDGKHLASGTRDDRIRIWNLEEGKVGEVVEEHLQAHGWGNFVFSPDNLWMAAGCADDTVRIWEVATLKLKSILTNANYVAAFSDDGQRVLVSSGAGTPYWRNLTNLSG